ncbi:MAG TPA: hypothetical protein VH643_14285 [Gemmataceae bacterium]|jgi:hypothetical protein
MSSREADGPSRTTADATPTVIGMIQSMKAGPKLEERLSRAFTLLGHPFTASGVSTSWSGAERLVRRLTTLGCYVEIQTHADHCLCKILRILKGNALSKQLASMDAPSLPEAIAKAALLTLVEMQPPTASTSVSDE